MSPRLPGTDSSPVRPRYMPSGDWKTRNSVPNASFISATVPEMAMLRRDRSTWPTVRSYSAANCSICSTSAGFAPSTLADFWGGMGRDPGAGNSLVFRRTTIVTLTSSFGSATPITLESGGAMRSLPRTATLSVDIYPPSCLEKKPNRTESRYHAHARAWFAKRTQIAGNVHEYTLIRCYGTGKENRRWAMWGDSV